jgi:DNA-directed RNA polymerase beta' subunit
MDTEVYSYDSERISAIDRIELSLLGNDEIANISAMGKDSNGIGFADLYDSFDPKPGGLIDPRMGTTDNSVDCRTCGLNTTFCVGHFAHITLAEPVFHVGYLNYVKKILSCVCLKCSKLLIYKNEDEIADMLKNKSKKMRMAEIRNLVKNVTHCQKQHYGCGTMVSKIKIDVRKATGAINIISETNMANIPAEEGANVHIEGKKKISYVLTPDMCSNILANISDIDCLLLGLDKICRPEKMIHKIFPVIPVAARPSTRADFLASSTMEDDLTHKLADIIKANNRIIKHKESVTEASAKWGQDNLYLLQYHIATYFDNETLTLPKSEKGKETRSVSYRLKGKEGRIRGNLMGKRVDFSARTVITSDPTISINQLGVPIKIAMTVTFPEVVTPQNIEHMKKLVRNGRDVYPGANYVFPASSIIPGQRVLPLDLRFKKETIELRFGDIVERHIVDDDIVLLNRQPTLHKGSMMGHRAKVINNPSLNTFRLSVAVTTPYNADFDGDEMNIFLPQSIQTQIELEEIADVKKQIISPQSSRTIIGIVQDGLLGAYNLTAPTMRIDWKSAMNIMSYSAIDDFKAFKKDKDYTGHELFSMIIPNKINISIYDDDKMPVLVIKNGNFTDGYLKKDVLGSGKKNNLVQLIWDEYGMEETKQFLDDTQRIVNNFNLYNGFTVGIGDLTISKDLESQIYKMFETKELKVASMITEIENNPDLMDHHLFEKTLMAELNVVRDDVSKILMANLQPGNNLDIMILSGSKGDPTNKGQMVGCVGLQAVEGKLVQKKVNGRSLPYFHQDDDTAVARGLIRQSFLKGLKFPEFVFLNEAAREGLIDTAIKSVTGDTKVVVMENGKTKCVQIGDWIDKLLAASASEIEHYIEREMELLNLKHEAFIPTADEDGVVSWGSIKAITRHLPGKELYEIKTSGGRKVIVTESKSLLIWNSATKKFERMSTPDVRIGDFVPVTAKLAVPPVITTHIDVSDYLSKDEFVKEGTISNCIYPYLASRDEMMIPDKFELNRENGLFVGLFLAEENVDIKSEYVQITNLDIDIRNFVKQWFEKISMKYGEDTKINHIGGTTTMVRGYSTILAKFLTELVGHGSHNKFVPNEAFNAPEEFIIGLINGYVSSDGTITDNSIDITSVSCELITGVNMLLSRLGIFGKVSKTTMKSNNLGTVNIAEINRLSIRSHWATLFSEKIVLIDSNKREKLTKLVGTNTYRNYAVQNDVVLDEIVEINLIDIKLYPKVYDLTIPSTLNFGLANGLHVVDTAETGYIQRKLVKSMEDAMVNYDGTVRTANKSILQFIYGDSGADTVKQYEHKIKMIEMGDKEIATKYVFADNEINKMKGYTSADNKAYFEELLQMRDLLRQTQIKSRMQYITMSTSFMIPVNISRIVDNIKNSADNKNSDKLEPGYIIERLNFILDNKNTHLVCMSTKDQDNKKMFRYLDDKLGKTVFRVALFEYLSPKKCILDYKLNKDKFDTIVNEIIDNYNKNMVEPGEMVGILAAQSMGEPLTQMTLNSIDWEEQIIIKINGKHRIVKIGELIDQYIREYPDKLVKQEDNLGNEMKDIYYVDISDQNIMVPAVNENGMMNWRKVTALTKHLPINKDGTNTLVKVTTGMGRTVTATKAKSFLTRVDNKIVPTRGDQLKVGTYLPIVKNYPKSETYLTHLNMSEFFSKTEYIYGSEIEKAREFKKKQNENGDNKWFTYYHGKEFTTPYSREDSLKCVLDGQIEQVYKEGAIYPKKGKDMIAEIPEQMLLDDLCGFFFGAFLAEGCTSSTQVQIANLDKGYQNKIIEFCKRYNIGNHVATQNDKTRVGWTTSSVVIHSVLLAKFMREQCGHLSHNKVIPEWVYDSNDEFVKGFLGGYFDGDGSIDKKYGVISCISVSENLINGVMILLSRFGIIGRKHKNKLQTENNRGSKDIKQSWSLTIKNASAKIFAENINLLIEHKNERIKINFNKKNHLLNNANDIIPGCKFEFTNESEIKISDLVERLPTLKGSDLENVMQTLNSDTYYDTIVQIDEVQPTREYVYDLTVDDQDKNFILFNTLNLADTFHHAGVAAIGTTTLGIPRVKELLSLSKKMKTPQMTVYLTKEYMENRDMANKIASHIKYITIGHLRKRIDIYYDPNPHKKGGFTEKDRMGEVFYSHNAGKNSCQADITGLPWLMRIELDREKLLDKEVTLLDIKSKFCNVWERRYSDMKAIKKEERSLLEKVTQCSVLSNTDNDDVPIIHIRFDMAEFDFTSINEFMDMVIDKFKLKGISSINDVDAVVEEVVLTYDGPDHAQEKKKQNVIYISGINLTDIRYISGIDIYKTIGNDVLQAYETFGIESARATLVREILFAYERAGKSVNLQHLSILADIMTNYGYMISIDRHGMNKSEADPFSRASFEKTVDQLLTGAVFGEVDRMKGISSRIMAGMVIKGGTGLCDLELDTEMLEQSEFTEDIGQKYVNTYNEISSSSVIADMINKNEADIYIPNY